jgi:hypothetical protein
MRSEHNEFYYCLTWSDVRKRSLWFRMLSVHVQIAYFIRYLSSQEFVSLLPEVVSRGYKQTISVYLFSLPSCYKSWTFDEFIYRKNQLESVNINSILYVALEINIVWRFNCFLCTPYVYLPLPTSFFFCI